MSSTTIPNVLDGGTGQTNLLDEPEHSGLLRLTKLVEHLFRVPIAYLALFKSDCTVATRIGSDVQYWENVKTYPLSLARAKPSVWPDPAGTPVPGFNSGELNFVAAAPLRSSDGLELGLLVIADVDPRPEFSRRDLATLAELAGVLAGKMELRLMACRAQELESSQREAESRFRNIADCAPVLIAYGDVDGGSSFVNKAWLEFTGRDFEEELGDGFADTFHPDHRERVMQAYWAALEARRPLRLEFPMRRQDGEYRWMEARGTPRTLDDGGHAGYIACLVDVTDRRTPAL